MKPIAALAMLCKRYDVKAHVHLEYGAHGGDIPNWQLVADLPTHDVLLNRALIDVTEATLSQQVQSLSAELRKLFPKVKRA